jgi:hypothetical protein
MASLVGWIRQDRGFQFLYGYEFGKKLTKPLAILIVAITLPLNQEISGICR